MLTIALAVASSPAATATPYMLQARPIGESVQIGVVIVSIGILVLISIPGLIWIRHNLFQDEDGK